MERFTAIAEEILTVSPMGRPKLTFHITRAATGKRETHIVESQFPETWHEHEVAKLFKGDVVEGPI